MLKEFYYYLVAGLPDLFLDQEKKDINILKIKEEMQELMHPKDYELVELLHFEYDNYNLLNHLLDRKQEFNDLGKFPKEFYDQFDENIEVLPQYMQNFLSWFKNNEQEFEELDNEEFANGEVVNKTPEVRFYDFFYSFILKQENAFIHQWFTFLQNFNNILTAINCREQGVEIAPQLVGNNDINEELIRSQAPDFGLKKDLDYLESLIQISEVSDILDRERRLDLIKWNMADEITTFDYFTVERILVFFIKAGIVYRWLKLDPKVGQDLFRKLVKDLRETYELPKEFAI